MFDNLSEKLQRVFKNLRGEGRLTAENMEAALREIREVFPHDTVEEAALTAFLRDLAARQFLQWI